MAHLKVRPFHSEERKAKSQRRCYRFTTVTWNCTGIERGG